jgi:predicted permease
MRWLKWHLFRERRYDDLAVSIKEHLEEKIEELMADGMSRDDAETTARREFGNVTLLEERSREVWQWPTVESLWADITFALRQLLKAPGFSATAITTLALGIAVNATMFSLVSAFLLTRPPGRAPQNVVVISSVSPSGTDQADTNTVSVPNYLAWRQDTRVFAQMAAADEYRTASLTGQGQPTAVPYAAVSSNYFQLFGVVPQLGRLFAEGEDQPGRAHVAILSHGLWAGRFGSDPAVVGRTIRLNREDYVVAGVMPADFRLLGFTPQLWTPLVLSAPDQTEAARKSRFLFLFARLARGVTLANARAELKVLAGRAAVDSPLIEGRWGASARTLHDFVVHNFGIRSALVVFMTAVGFVLLIACANVAGLLLTRAAGRQREIAIRVSIGASRLRIVRQLVTEGFVIALLGGSAGLLLSYVGINLLRANLDFNEAISAFPVSLDVNVLLFVSLVSLLSATFSSLAPALKSAHADVNSGLKSESRAASPGRSQSRLRVVLVSGEIALALFLLTGTAILIRGVSLLDHQTLGFRTDHLLTANMGLDTAHYSDGSHQLQFVRDLVSRLRQIPEVQDVAVVSDLPATNPGTIPIFIQGKREIPENEQRSALDAVVMPDYFSTFGIPVLRGRVFSQMDNANASRVVLVNQEFVHRYLAGKDPLGERIKLDIEGALPGWSEIVGVVGDVKSYSEEARVDPEVYESLLQRPVPSFSVALRTKADPNDLIPTLRKAVFQLDAELPLGRVMSMDAVMNYQRNGNPLFMRALGTFAFLALVLAAIGIYGLIAYSVGRRTHEIGIRMAVGAKTKDILHMILREGFKTAAIGSALGLVISLPLPSVFDSLFQGVHFEAPTLHIITLVAILIVSAFAIYIPALRATRVDPNAALRDQ